jgi:hypothetical protein
MPRSFDLLAESPASVEQIHSAFGDRDYWLARVEAFGGGTTALDSLTVGAGGTVRVAIIQDLGRALLPGIVAKIYRRDLKILHTEIWRPLGDRQLRGEVSVAASGAPGSGCGSALLAPAPNGSRLSFAVTVEFKVPLVGGTIESFIGGQFADEFPAIGRFTTAWVTGHA